MKYTFKELIDVPKLQELTKNKKLTLLVVFAVMPCLAILLYSGIEFRTHLIEDAQSNVLLISHNMALAQKEVSESTKKILSTLSLLPSIQAMDSTASSIILRAVLDKENRPKAALATAVKLAIFSKFYDVETLPEKSFVAVTDHKGIRLFYYPAQKDTNPVGKPIRAKTWDIVTFLQGRLRIAV